MRSGILTKEQVSDPFVVILKELEQQFLLNIKSHVAAEAFCRTTSVAINCTLLPGC